MDRTVGVLLAAGAGIRFSGGSHKLLAAFGGRPVAAWSLDALRAARLYARAVIVGAVDLSLVLPPGIAVIDNPRWAEGQATSLQAAVRFAESEGADALVIGLADQPLVPATAWEAVAAAHETPVVTASFAGERRPPVRLDRSVWDLLPQVGDEGARVLMRAHPELVSEVACAGGSIDIDTMDDLAEACADRERPGA